MAITAPRDAPAETPRRPGSASGLRVSPWSTAPHIPSVPPTAMASTVRGKRSSITINEARVGLDENRPSHISAGLTHTRPANSDTTDSAASVTRSALLTNAPRVDVADGLVRVAPAAINEFVISLNAFTGL